MKRMRAQIANTSRFPLSLSTTNVRVWHVRLRFLSSSFLSSLWWRWTLCLPTLFTFLCSQTTTTTTSLCSTKCSFFYILCWLLDLWCKTHTLSVLCRGRLVESLKERGVRLEGSHFHEGQFIDEGHVRHDVRLEAVLAICVVVWRGNRKQSERHSKDRWGREGGWEREAERERDTHRRGTR